MQKPYSLSEHLAMSVLLSRYSENVVMVPFSAYFDASGTVDSDVLTVAGFSSTVKKWIRFDIEWASILKSEGIKVFHMTDFVSSKGEFTEGWEGNTERRKRFINALTQCLYRNVNKSFRTTLIVRDYKKVNASFLLSEKYGMPYALCAIMSVYTLRRWAKRKGAENRLLYYFEDGDKGKGDFDAAHSRLYSTPVLFLTKDQASPLQAADFAAWKIRTAVKAASKPDHTQEKGRELLRSIEFLKKIPRDAGIIHEPALLKWCAEFKVPRR